MLNILIKLNELHPCIVESLVVEMLIDPRRLVVFDGPVFLCFKLLFGIFVQIMVKEVEKAGKVNHAV